MLGAQHVLLVDVVVLILRLDALSILAVSALHGVARIATWAPLYAIDHASVR